jgi:hypothetical protein
MVYCPEQVASDSEEILDNSVRRPESLRLSQGFEPRAVKKLMHGFSWTVDRACLWSRQESTAL